MRRNWALFALLCACGSAKAVRNASPPSQTNATTNASPDIAANPPLKPLAASEAFRFSCRNDAAAVCFEVSSTNTKWPANPCGTDNDYSLDHCPGNSIATCTNEITWDGGSQSDTTSYYAATNFNVDDARADCAVGSGIFTVTDSASAAAVAAPSCHGAAITCDTFTSDTCGTQSGCDVPQVCSGAPNDCSGRDSNSCDGGCSWQYVCGGGALDCSNLVGSCTNQAGCLWNSFGDFCSGTAVTCDQIPANACSTQFGCSIRGACAGTPDACSTAADASSCGDRTGCNWGPATTCSGSAKTCDTIISQDDCGAQQGCSWH